MIGVLLLAFVSMAHIEKPFLTARCDVLELNHVYDSKATHNFSQLLAWNWDEGQLHCDWWVLVGKKHAEYRLCGTYAELYSNDNWYRVIYGEFTETWTQYDRDLNDRLVWPEECRRELPKRMPQGVEP